MMRVLLLGGNGFIGSHITDRLLREEIEVVVLDKIPERFRTPISRVEYIYGDLADGRVLEQALARDIDAVVHLASATTPQLSMRNPAAELQNLALAFTLFQKCTRLKIPKVLFASSGGTVYGAPVALPVAEHHPANPLSPYGITKLVIEDYLQYYSRMGGFQHIILRIANPYGIRQSPFAGQGVVTVFTHRVLNDEPVTILGDGNNVRDIVHVRDVAELCYLALVSDATGVFNAGTGVGISVNEVLERITAQLRLRPRIIRQEARVCDIPAIVLDCRKAQQTFSWCPRITLEEGLRELAEWLRYCDFHQLSSGAAQAR